MNFAQLLENLRNLSYDSGWISGKIEAGGNYDADAQNNCIRQRELVYAGLQNGILELKQQVAAMVDALEKAPKPMASLTAEELKDNWKAVDHWFAVYNSWIEDVATKALALMKGKDSEREK